MTVEEAEKAEKSDEVLEKYRLAGKILAEVLEEAVKLSLIHISEPTRPY